MRRKLSTSLFKATANALNRAPAPIRQRTARARIWLFNQVWHANIEAELARRGFVAARGR